MSKINLTVPEVQVREVRINSITNFQGSAEELVGCSRRGLKNGSRSFTQCAGCSINYAACNTVLVQDAVVISHGPLGCSSGLHRWDFIYSVNASRRWLENPTQRKIFSTNLTEKETVYGGGAKLEAAIREVYEQCRPNAVFVLTTCAAGIIGDDVESVCDAAGEELGIPVVAVFCEGFRSTLWTSGFDSGYHGIARKLIKPPKQRRDDMVNIINFWGAEVFTDWLAPFGAKPNYLTPYSTVESLSRAGEAAVTIQTCSTLGSYLGAVLEQEFGVPEIPAAQPFGIAQTDRWFRALGKALGKEDVAELVIAEKKKEFLPKIEALKEKLKNIIPGRAVRAYVIAGAAHGHALLSLIRELGIEIVGAGLYHHDPLYDNERPENDQLAQSVRDYGDVPNFNVCNKQEFELVNALNRFRPDIMFARHTGITLCASKLGIPTLHVLDTHISMGYEGLLRYGERIFETLENDEFVKNLAKNTVIPYTKWWLGQKPDTFVTKKAV